MINLLFLALQAHASNTMENFAYSDCAKEACVLVTAPHASLGASQINFTTSGRTELRLTDSKGRNARSFVGESATFNPSMQTMVLDTENGGFVLYSLRDGTLSDFRKRGTK